MGLVVVSNLIPAFLYIYNKKQFKKLNMKT